MAHTWRRMRSKGFKIVPLDATIAGANSESYLTLAESNTLATNYGLAKWLTLSDAKKETALRRATQDIDAHKYSNLKKYSAIQALIFPRWKDEGKIPIAVQLATIYQAEFIACSGEYDRKQWEGAKGGPLKDAGNGSPLCPRAFALVAKLITRVGEYA